MKKLRSSSALTARIALIVAGTLVLGALVSALVFSCKQETEAPVTAVSEGVFTLDGTEIGAAYTVRVYPYAGGSTSTRTAWIEATTDANLAAVGDTLMAGGTASISLSKPDGGTFTSSRTYIAAITLEADWERDEETRFTVAVFENGSASANWHAIKRPPEEDAFTIVPSETGVYRFPDVSAEAGNETLPSMSVIVRNTGIAASVPLTVTLDESAGTSAFIVERANLSGIEAGGNASFTVRLASGLPVGTYTATVNVRADPGADQQETGAVFTSFVVTSSVGGDSHGISLSRSGHYPFPTAAEGYDAADSLSVKVYNSGTEAADGLYAALSGLNPEAFRLTRKDLGALDAGGSSAFTVAPVAGLKAGAYTATVTVGGNTGTVEPETKSFTVGFTVTPADGQSVYGIELSEAGDYEFPSRSGGYANTPSVSVNIVNTGNKPTGRLAVRIDGPFTTDNNFIESLPAGRSAFFSVAPESDLAAGNYSGTVTVTGANGNTDIAAKSFYVNFIVANREVGIDITPSDTYSFPAVGKWTEPLEVRVRNTGNQPTGTISLTLEGTGAGAYGLSNTSLPPIAEGASAVVTVSPVSGLAAGSSHTAILRASSTDGIADKTLVLSFNVPEYAISLNRTGVYLFPDAAQGYGTAGFAAPAILLVGVNNVGNHPTGPLSVTVTPDVGTDVGDFVVTGLSDGTVDSIAVNEAVSFMIAPRTGLSAEGSSASYGATVTVSRAADTPISVSDTSASRMSAGTSASDTSVDTSASRMSAFLAASVGNISASFRVSFTVSVGHTVRFAVNGGGPVNDQLILHGKYATGPEATKDKLRLKGWYTDAGTPFNFAATPIVADIALNAVWEADVTFNTNGGSGSIPPQTVDEGAHASAPANPTGPAGWSFEYWYLSDESMPYNFATAAVMKDTQLTAKWSYAVSFDANGGTGGPPEQYVLSKGFTAKPVAAVNPVRSGYIFRDWFKTASANNAAFNFSGEAVTGPLVLYAGWTQLVTVTMNKDGGLWKGNAGQDTYSLPPGSTFTPTTGIVKEGYTLANWCTDAAKTDTVTSITVNANTTLYAKWSPNTYTITMNKSGGYWEGAPDTFLAMNHGPLPAVIGQDTYSAVYGTSFTITTAPIIREGYSFQGWYMDSWLTTKAGPTVTVTGDMTLYARWQNEPEVYVKFRRTNRSDITVTVPYSGRLPIIFNTSYPLVPNNRFLSWGYDNSPAKLYWGVRFYASTSVHDEYTWDWDSKNWNKPFPGWDALYHTLYY